MPPEQAEAVDFLRRLAQAPPVETHISWVFLGADTVWKLKKAVRLPFLDFTSVEARRRFVLRELELNHPAAPGLYRDMVAIVRRPDGSLALSDGPNPDLPVLDWVLRMARVPACDFLDVVAAANRLTPDLLDALGDAVADFHQGLTPVIGEDTVAAMRGVTVGNARSALAAGLPAARIHAWAARALATLAALASWMEQRSKDGWVRRAHGDLHLGNLCLWQQKPVPFDALEFDETMATIDLGYDLAFLLMDLDQRAGRAAANRALNRYVARTGDAALTHGLPVFLSLRAMIRAHVEAQRGNAMQAAHYLEAADRYLRPVQPVVLAIGGLPGTGKSTLARALAPELGNAPGALVLRSDEIRKRQHGAAPEERLTQSAYGEAAHQRVFAELAKAVETTAGGGHAVIADATFIDQDHRLAVETAAHAAGVPFLGLWLEAPLGVLERRVSSRRRDASDATAAVLHAAASATPQAGDWTPITALVPDETLAAARTALLRHGDAKLVGLCYRRNPDLHAREACHGHPQAAAAPDGDRRR